MEPCGESRQRGRRKIPSRLSLSPFDAHRYSIAQATHAGRARRWRRSRAIAPAPRGCEIRSGKEVTMTTRILAHYRWVVVAAGGLLGCVAIGAMFSLPV